MDLAVVGAGQVGAVVAGVLADAGHDVVCVERDPARREALARGEVPFHEPGLDPLWARGLRTRRLTVVDEDADVGRPPVIVVAVGTPPGAGGVADLTAVFDAVDRHADAVAEGGLVVLKSTVTVGTAAAVQARLEARGRGDITVVANPEFLSEGRAVEDYRHPARVVLGCDRPGADAPLVALYAALVGDADRIVRTDTRSAELAKYAANVHLAARVSLMNELASVAEAVGADIEAVRTVVGGDPRIGPGHLQAGAGFGGSCFPKDLLALEGVATQHGVDLAIVPAVRAVNLAQPGRVVARLVQALGGDVAGRRVAVWGLAYKPGTDDLRQAPAVAMVEDLVARGATVVAHDPAAGARAAALWGESVQVVDDPWAAVQDADALLLATEWPLYRSADPQRLARGLRQKIVVDGRNVFDPAAMARAGIAHVGVGRPSSAVPPRSGSWERP